MWELFRESILPLNFPYTLLLGLVLFYWLTVFVGAMGLEILNFDVDIDADVDVDVDVDVDTDVDTGHHSSFSWGKILHFFNIGDVPFMIILSFMSLFMWMGSVLFNHYMANTSGLIAFGMFFPLFLVSLFLTKFCSTPLVKLFAAFDTQADKSVIGAVCKVKVAASETQLGQAEVDTDDFHQLVNIKAVAGLTVKKGDSVLILEYKEKGNFYIVDRS